MKKIILSRLDNIGDVILTLPLISYIKSIYPNAEIIYIAKSYSLPVLSSCNLISRIIEWERLEEMDEKQLVSYIASLKADTFIHSTPKRKLARAVYRAGVPIRIGSARRIFHWLYCNKRPWIRDHRHCLTHMSDHFMALAKPLSKTTLPNAYSISVSNTLHFSAPLPESTSNLLSENRFNIILHPGSNNHAPEWPTAHFLPLTSLLPADKFNILVTGTIDEQERFQNTLLLKLPDHACNLMGTLNLPQFLSLISTVDGVVASSTGPIHVSGALNKKTLGFYPPRTPNSFDWELTAHKWKPLGNQVTTLTSTPSCEDQCTTRTFSSCHCMAEITPTEASKTILRWLN
jgi:ADP-heptose:LPS heptosyltransferase